MKGSTVVAVLTINCQVSEKCSSGPVTAQTKMKVTAVMKVAGWPMIWAHRDAMRVKRWSMATSGGMKDCPSIRGPGRWGVRLGVAGLAKVAAVDLTAQGIRLAGAAEADQIGRAAGRGSGGQYG